MIALNTTHAATTTLISVNGSVYTDKSSNNPSLNYDGSKIVFVSQSGKLVGDTNSQSNVYLKNRNTNTLKRISLSKNSTTQAANKASYGPDISADGNKIVFYSLATDIVSSDTNGKTDVFLHDLTTGKSQLVSVTQSGVQGNAESTEAQISDDGNFVAFSSASTTLTGINTNNKRHIYVKNLSTQSLEIVSVNNAGEAGDQDSFSPSISGDGRYITFVSIANNFDSHSASGQYDIYLHDRQNGVTERISFGDTGVVSNSHSSLPSISADGRYISYMSLASNLASNDTDNTMDIFVYDRETGNVEKATTTATTSGPSYSPKISSNGRFVAFYSSAFNLVSDDNNGRDDFFVYDRYLKTTELLSISATGAQTSKNVDSVVAISGDGKITAFASADDTLVSGDSNRTSDVFVRVRDNIANLKPFAKSTPVASQECNNGGAYITLDASGSYDLDKDALTINWSGPFGNVSGAIVSVFVGYGSHAVTLTVTDSAGNKDQKTISLNVVDTISPTITAENDLTLEATHVNGAQHNVNFTANDNCGIVNTIVSPSPLYYSLGVNNITVSAVDNAGHTASDVTKVTVVDTTAPALSIPSDLTKEATGRQSVISVGNAKATDIFPVTITNDSTGTFSLGQTTIKWTATDSNGNSISRSQKITVKDTTSPVLNIPADITSEATNVLSALNIGAATATDIFNVAVSNNAPL
ncbi:MAG: hypothetical protein OEX07_13715, partial [Gammaproteobacteria bacterium]|nr:hypothetical protein [Gammaproteobacteria bacterium]